MCRQYIKGNDKICMHCMKAYSTTSYSLAMHWLPLSDRIQFKVLALVLKSKLGLTPTCLRDVIRPPLSASSHRPLRSLDRSDLFVPRARTTIAQTRSFAIIGPSLWNALPFSLRETFLSGRSSSLSP